MTEKKQTQIHPCRLGELEKFILITFLHIGKYTDIASLSEKLKQLCTSEEYKLYIAKTTTYTVVMRLVKKKLLRQNVTLSRLKTFTITDKGKEELAIAMHNTIKMTEVYKKVLR